MTINYYGLIGTVFCLIQVYTLESTAQDCGGNGPMYKITTINGDVKCAPCTKCPVGFGVVTECSDERDTQCEPCAEGTYSAGNSRTSPCRPCRTCPPHLPTTINCTNTQNVKCAEECDDAYFKDILTDECSQCSWCFPNNPEIAPPVIQECVDQRMPRNYQCMPSNNGGDVPTYEAHIEENYHHGAYVQTIQNESVLVKTAVPLNVTVPSSELRVSTSSPAHTSLYVTVVAPSCSAVIVILACIILIMYVRRSSNKKLHKYDNIGECYSTPASENFDAEQCDANYHCNPIELSTFIDLPGKNPVVCDDTVLGGKHADTLRFIESDQL